MSNHNSIKFVKKWLPVFLWAGVISFFSTEHFSAPQSSRILGPILYWLFPDIAPDQVAAVQFVVRKLSHCLEYAILAVLLYRALYAENGGRSSIRPAAWTMTFVVVWAATDEFHQSFVPSRTASVVDVMIDGFGGLFGTLWMYLRRK